MSAGSTLQAVVDVPNDRLTVVLLRVGTVGQAEVRLVEPRIDDAAIRHDRAPRGVDSLEEVERVGANGETVAIAREAGGAVKVRVVLENAADMAPRFELGDDLDVVLAGVCNQVSECGQRLCVWILAAKWQAVVTHGVHFVF